MRGREILKVSVMVQLIIGDWVEGVCEKCTGRGKLEEFSFDTVSIKWY